MCTCVCVCTCAHVCVCVSDQVLLMQLAQVSARLDEEIGTASHLSEALEQEQCAHRETREKLTQVEVRERCLEGGWRVGEDVMCGWRVKWEG